MKKENNILVIYNPNAGKKRKLTSFGPRISLEEIKDLFDKYQLLADFSPTKHPQHATQLAKEAVREGYKIVVAAGGDGTVSEVANGLIESDVSLGIIPLGSFMNIARMLSIPTDLEKAVMLLKIGRTRKIDMGTIIRISGDKPEDPMYFIETAGIGLEAQFHKYFLEFERGNFSGLFKLLKMMFEFYGHSAKVYMDDENIETKATLVSVSNGPYTGAALNWAPDAKLNDHKLTVSIFKMSKLELSRHFFKLLLFHSARSRKVKIYKAEKVKIVTEKKRLIHADARIFGTTPIELKIIPNALSVVTGFPTSSEQALNKRTFLDP